MKHRRMKALLLAGVMTPLLRRWNLSLRRRTASSPMGSPSQRKTCWSSCTSWKPSTESGKLMQNYRTNGTYGYGGYASMISSLIFGDKTNPCRRIEDLTQIRPGDIVFRVSNSTGKI